MEELHSRHRKEQRDLQARITQKKKGASKKNRKGINTECDELERQLKEQHEQEIADFNGVGDPEIQNGDGQDLEDTTVQEAGVPQAEAMADVVENSMNGLSIKGTDCSPKKRNRQKDRLARRAAEQEALVAQAEEEAAKLPDRRAVEIADMQVQFRKRGLKEEVIRPDGHCLYSSIADQLQNLGIGPQLKVSPTIIQNDREGREGKLPGYKIVRTTAADYVASNSEDFLPFLEEPIDDYVHKIRDTAEWGGQLELLALAKSYKVNINVLQSDGSIVNIAGGLGQDEQHDVWLAYYKHSFGLGEHYNSLRKTGNSP
jgi:OTU domain-containing protein 6